MEKLTKNPACASMAGNKKLFFASISIIESVDLVSDNTASIQFVSVSDWIEIETSDVEFSSIKSENHYVTEILSNFHAAANKYDRYFNRMTEDRFICKIIDNNNIPWILGSYNFPLKFDFKHLSGPSAQDDHIYELHFFNKSLDSMMISNS